jgi:hypothetical protein
MFNYWWLFFGTLLCSGLVGSITALILRQRYLQKFGQGLNFIDRVFFERRFYRQVLFSSPEWIHQDRLNLLLQGICRIATLIYLGGFIGFLIIALLLS